jgi:hypothetical protein
LDLIQWFLEIHFQKFAEIAQDICRVKKRYPFR